MVNLSLAKLHLNISHDVDDVLIQSYIDSAVGYIDKDCAIKIEDLHPTPPALDQVKFSDNILVFADPLTFSLTNSKVNSRLPVFVVVSIFL
jgi:hypothetical protein